MIYQLQQYIQLIDNGQQISQNSNLQQLVSILQEAQIQNSKQALNNFAQLTQIISNCASGVIQEINPNITLRILRVAISVIGSFKNKFRKSGKYDEYLKKIVEVNLKLIASISSQISQDWAKPPEGVNLNTDSPQQQNLSNDALGAFDVLIDRVGLQKLAGLLNSVSAQIIQLDWRNKYAFLMGFSQLGEYVSETQYIVEYVNYTLKSLKHNNPKIRFASLHAIGQLSDDMRPSFQQNFTDLLLPMILQALNDPVPRVVSHALACLTNFLQDFYDIQKLSTFIPALFKKLLELMQDPNTISLVNQSNVSTLASICTVQNLLAKDQVELGMKIIKKAYERYHQGIIYHQMRSQILQGISFLIGAQDHQYTKKYLPFILQLLKKALTEKIAANDYILDAWARIFKYFQNLPLQVSTIMDAILAFAVQQDDGSIIKKVISTTSSMMVSYKDKLRPQIKKVIKFFTALDSSKLEEPQTKIQLLSFYKQIVTLLKSQAPDPNWQEIIKDLYDFDIQQIKNMLLLEQVQRSYKVLQHLLNLMIVIIQSFGLVFTNQELVKHSQQIYLIFPQIEKVYAEQRFNFKEFQQEVDKNDQIDQELQLRQTQTNQLNDARLLIPDMVQALLRVIPQQLKKLIIKEVMIEVGKILESPDSLPSDIQYGIYYIDNILQDNQFQQLKQYWPTFNIILSKYSISADNKIRNSAIFGLGILISKSPPQLIVQNDIKTWLKIIKDSLAIPKGAESSKYYSFCLDNCVSAFGKFLKTFYFKFDSTQQFAQWLQMLPLNSDKTEGNIQQQFLMQLIQKNPSLIITNKQSLLYVLKAHANFLAKRKSKKFDEYRNKIKNSMLIIKKWPLFMENNQYFWNCLTEQQKKILIKVVQQ